LEATKERQPGRASNATLLLASQMQRNEWSVQELLSRVKFLDSQPIPSQLIVGATEGNYFGTQPRIAQPPYPSQLSAGGNIRPASAHAHHGVTTREGKHAHNAVGIGEAGAWRHDHHERRGMREKLLSSSHPPERHADRSTESGHPFEGSGIASVYSDRHTASGEHMNSGAMTAAHRTLPFGTRVTVVNRSNGRSAVVRINDRGPFVRGRVIDLSPTAAHVLGIDGLTSVSLTIPPKAHRPGWLERPRPL
jgi:rare lipoprotein A